MGVLLLVKMTARRRRCRHFAAAMHTSGRIIETDLKLNIHHGTMVRQRRINQRPLLLLLLHIRRGRILRIGVVFWRSPVSDWSCHDDSVFALPNSTFLLIEKSGMETAFASVVGAAAATATKPTHAPPPLRLSKAR
jgi:hypothetical protein